MMKALMINCLVVSLLLFGIPAAQSLSVPSVFINAPTTELLISETAQQANGNQTINQNIDSSVWTAIIGAVASVFGVFIGFLLNERATMRLKKEECTLSILKGICSLLSEVKDNQEQVKKGCPVALMA